MTKEDEAKSEAGLVPSQSAALSQAGRASLVRRVTQDSLALDESAEQWLKRGRQLWAQRKDPEAVWCFERGLQLDSNHAGLQYCLGRAYYLGEGVAQDYAHAVAWWRKAAEQGDADAQRALGHACADGLGVPQDHVEAAIWFRRAAEQGHAGAQNALAWLYKVGEGVPKDHVEAAIWFRRAAEQGHAGARNALAWLSPSTV